jgi:hypothetical protein
VPEFLVSEQEENELDLPLAMRILSVPATSAPVERVFSHGGILMRPHRASMSDKTLADFVFLKCNASCKKI